MKRREFITLLGGAAVAWPLAARAQHMRRVGVLMNLAADDLEGQARQAAFLQGLQEVGWAVGRNLRIDIRWGNNDPNRIRRNVAELVATAPDVILAAASPVIAALQAATSTVPIVFAAVIDPIVDGFVASLNRPGGNMTGFTTIGHGISAKWLELLKDVAPRVKHVAVLFHPSNPSSQQQVSAIQAVAPSLAVELTPIHLRDVGEFERAVTAFAQTPNSGLIVTLITETIWHRELILTLAARHRLPAVYGLRVFAAEGGLVAYGADVVDQFRRAAEYVDRILKGAKPADLPVIQPTKFELVINLKTAKALGLDVPDAARPRRRGHRMKRREFITLLGGAAAWPLAARAEQDGRVRRIGVLMSTAAGDAEGRARIAAFLDELKKLGWIGGRTARIDMRWPASTQEVRKYSAELVGLAPDVLLATGSAGLSDLLETTRTVPIVFVNVGDPVGGGFVESLARPGGNATGFSFTEYSVSVKWLELLKEIAPGLARVAVLRDARQASGSGQFGAIQAVAPSFGVELTPIDVRDASEIERAVTAFVRSAKAGLIITTGQMTLVHRDLIINLAARHALPTVY